MLLVFEEDWRKLFFVCMNYFEHHHIATSTLIYLWQLENPDDYKSIQILNIFR